VGGNVDLGAGFGGGKPINSAHRHTFLNRRTFMGSSVNASRLD